MINESLTYQQLTPECQLDALASIGIYPETGLLALNSYENRVYSFCDEQQVRYVVKFYRPTRWNEAQLIEEHRFCEHLLEAGLNLSAPLVINGNRLHLFNGYHFALFNNLSARSLDIDNIDNLYDVGCTLGKMHKISTHHQFESRPTLNIQQTIQQATLDLTACPFIPNAIQAPLFETIEKITCKIKTHQFNNMPAIAIHGDAHASNILLKNGQPYWVDFDDCKMGPAVQDIWMLLSGDKADQYAQLSMILEGYQEEHDFDLTQLKYIEALRSMRIISYVSWINNRWKDPAFSRNFPWFTTDQYWKELLQSLQQQLIQLDEPAVTLQPQY